MSIKETLKNRNDLLLQFFGMKKSIKLFFVIFLLICLYRIAIPAIALWYILPVEKFANTKKKAVTSMIIFSLLSLFVIFPLIYSTVYVCKDYHPIKSYITKQQLRKQNELEYKKAKAELEANAEKERVKLIAKAEQDLNKIFYKIDFRQMNKEGNGIYDFYITPLAWYQLNVDQKRVLFENCMAYVYLKTNTKENYPKFATKIKSSTNGEVLAKYSFKGFECK